MATGLLAVAAGGLALALGEIRGPSWGVAVGVLATGAIAVLLTVLYRATGESGRAGAGRAASEEILQTAFDASPSGMLMVDPEGTIVMANRRAESTFGYAAGELEGRSVEALLPARLREVHEEERREFLAAPAARQMGAGRDLRGRRRDGSEVPVEIGLSPVERDGGTYVLASIIDITERLATVEALRDREERLRQVTEAIREVYFLVDARFRETHYVSPAYEEVWGRSVESLYESPRSFLEAVVSDDRPGLIEHIERVQGGAAKDEYEFRIRRPDGEVRWILVRASAVRDERGDVYRIAGVALDITERARLREQLQQAQKMEAIGRLAGGVAHDFNNLLTAILGPAELLLLDMEPDDPARSDLLEIRSAAGRAAGLTRQLLAFSRRQVLEPRVVDLNDLVANLEKMLRRMIGEDVELITAPGEELGAVRVDPGQLEQVIVNLAVNSRDAMPEGGTLAIETNNAELDEAYSESHRRVSPGHYVMLAVTDTGTGMDATIRSRIFEPFFTTKPEGKGTGLGLATVYGIVEQSGGFIWVYSEPGRGTTFKIYLPRVDETAEVLAGPGEGAESLAGSETLLVVEDEKVVRAATRRMLEVWGYRVLAAGSGKEALALARRHAGELSLLLTDVVMPEMSGADLAEALAEIRPEIRIVYMSGYTDETIVRHGVLAPGTHFLQKPFTPDTLARKVRAVLDAPRG